MTQGSSACTFRRKAAATRHPFPAACMRGPRKNFGLNPGALAPSPLIPHLLDRIRDRDRALRHLGMQPLDHPPVELDRAARGILRQFEGCDDLARLGDLLRRRREDRIAGTDVAWMDQRLAVKAEVAASLSASSTARAVSIMAQTLTEAGAPTALRRAPTLPRSSTVETFGTRMPSGTTAPAMATSSLHQEVSRLLVRISTSRLPKPFAPTAFAICSRAPDLASGATESSR